jgi:hypothetical protein
VGSDELCVNGFGGMGGEQYQSKCWDELDCTVISEGLLGNSRAAGGQPQSLSVHPLSRPNELSRCAASELPPQIMTVNGHVFGEIREPWHGSRESRDLTPVAGHPRTPQMACST